MTLAIIGTKSALLPNNTASFIGTGGTGPYTYSVAPFVLNMSGAGGTINSSTGLYTAPATVQTSPRNFYDQVIVTDSATPTPNTATANVLVGYPWMLVADILITALSLTLDRVYFWNVKDNMPKDNSMFLVIAMPRQKPIASNNYPSGTAIDEGGPGWSQATSWTQVNSTLDIHVYSRGLDALYRLPEIFAALQGQYCRNQQRACGFYLSKVPHNAVDVSGIDGAAIPYHYVISLECIWTFSYTQAPPYWATFAEPEILVSN